MRDKPDLRHKMLLTHPPVGVLHCLDPHSYGARIRAGETVGTIWGKLVEDGSSKYTLSRFERWEGMSELETHSIPAVYHLPEAHSWKCLSGDVDSITGIEMLEILDAACERDDWT